MTHEELLTKIDKELESRCANDNSCCFECSVFHALRAVVELHKPYGEFCNACAFELRTTVMGFPIEYLHTTPYPCPTIQAIEKELQ